MATATDVQKRLVELGYGIAVDGNPGPQTYNALMAALASSKPAIVPATQPISKGKLRAIVAHWSVTGYKCTDLCKQHYHFTVEGDGKVIAGFHTIEDNFNTADGDYAAHTRAFNTGVVGIACAAMMGAESVIRYGQYPILEEQFEAMCRKMAEICKQYSLPVTPKTTLSHAEVEPTLGIKQAGKWDISVLPYAGLTTAKACGDYMRKRILSHM